LSPADRFFDLIFVAIIAVLAEAAIEDPTGNGLVRYIITFWAAYNIWSGLRENMNMFWNDDVLQKTFIMWIMVLLITYGNNAPYVDDAPHEVESEVASHDAPGSPEEAASEGHAALMLVRRAAEVASSHHYEGGGRTTTIIVYIVTDLSLVIGRLGYSFYVHQVRKQLRIQSFFTFISIALYIAAIFTSVGAAIGLVVAGLAWEYILWVCVFSPHLKKWLNLEYSSAVNSKAFDIVYVRSG
jgi:low temperature requirement protein LtrA